MFERSQMLICAIVGVDCRSAAGVNPFPESSESMNGNQPLKIGVVGIGGYGGSIIHLLTQESAGGPEHFDLVAVCSNDFPKHPKSVDQLTQAGVKLVEDYDEFLKLEMDAVWLPLPIPLHRPFTEKALAAGKVVMCEKPAAGSVDDVDGMIAAREKYKLPVAIGFQDVYDPTTLPLKREILAGDLGKIKHATVMACWPRDSQYYGRADWAGAFKIGQSWVMDSPVNNALSHYVNLPLFLLGQDEASSAKVLSIESELYRVNPIENYDTASVRINLEGDKSLLVLFTHACEETINPCVWIQGENGSVVRTSESIEITTPKGKRTVTRDTARLRASMVERLANLIRNVPDTERGLATLEVARTQVLVVNAASEASAVHQLPDEQFNILQRENDTTLRVIPGISELFTTCAKNNQMLHESGLANWTKPAGKKEGLLDYRHFAGPRQ